MIQYVDFMCNISLLISQKKKAKIGSNFNNKTKFKSN